MHDAVVGKGAHDIYQGVDVAELCQIFAAYGGVFPDSLYGGSDIQVFDFGRHDFFRGEHLRQFGKACIRHLGDADMGHFLGVAAGGGIAFGQCIKYGCSTAFG
jgi:hypothetical protein